MSTIEAEDDLSAESFPLIIINVGNHKEINIIIVG